MHRYLLVGVKLFGGMECFIQGTSTDPRQIIPVEVKEGFSVRMLLNQLRISEEVGFFLLNDVYQDCDTILAEGDRISLFPAI